MKGIISMFFLAAWTLCLVGGLVATISNGEYVQAAGVAVTSLMALPYVRTKIKEGLQ